MPVGGKVPDIACIRACDLPKTTACACQAGACIVSSPIAGPITE
jgi:hypothetical protein